jgi:predicted nucleotide-binding protein
MSDIINLAAALRNAILREAENGSYGVPKSRLEKSISAYSKIRQDLIDLLGLKSSYFGQFDYPTIYEVNEELYYKIDDIVSIDNEMATLLEVWSQRNSANSKLQPLPRKVFVSHGRGDQWRRVQEYVERTLKIPTLELAQEANKGRTVFQKLIDESENCGFAVIVMTGDDQTTDEQVRARENVMHEIGYFQGKYGADRVCLLHENGVNIPSNIGGLVYIQFPKDGIEAALGGLTRELNQL